MKMVESPICEQCGEDEETAEHFISECPAYGRIRMECFKKQFLAKEDLLNIRINSIMNFVNRTGRFMRQVELEEVLNPP